MTTDALAPARPAVARAVTTTVWIALDIETCPLPVRSPAAEARLAAETLRHDGNAAKAASLHPHTGYVCAVGVASQRSGDESPRSRAFVAETPGDEARLLDDLWRYVARAELHARQQRLRLRWTTFNGKGFDVVMLRLRSLACGLALPDSGFFDVYPYKDTPHFDLMGPSVTGRFAFTLDQLCDLLGLESPKAGMDGAGVAAAMADGRTADVAAYAERDALATLALAQRVAGVLGSR